MTSCHTQRTLPRGRRSRTGGLVVLAAAVSLLPGCFSGSPSRRDWLSPLGLVSKKQDLGDQPEFRQQVNRDPFPSATATGVATRLAGKDKK